MKAFILIISGLFINLMFLYKLSAQTTHTLQPIPGQRLQVSDLWQVTVNNPLGEQRAIYLEARIQTEDGIETANFRTAPMVLPRGIVRINPMNIQVVHQQYHKEEVRRIYAQTGNFPEGDYRICVNLMLEEDHTLLSEDCREHTVVNPRQFDGSVEPGRIGRQVNFSGNGYIEGHMANRQGPFQEIPQNYLRTDINSTLSFSVLPFNMRVFHSTEQSHYLQNMNAITLQFDEHRFKNNLRVLVSEKIMEEENLKKLTHVGEFQKLEELEKLEMITGQIELLNESESSGTFDNIDQSLESLDISYVVNSANNLRIKIRQTEDQRYEKQIDDINQAIIHYDSLYFDDAELESFRLQMLVDLRKELIRIDNERDSLMLAREGYQQELKFYEQQMQNYRHLERRKQQFEQLKAQRKEYESLMERRNELISFRENLQASGRIDELRGFDYAILDDPDVLRKKLMEYNLLRGERKIFYNIERLAVGTVYPSFSSLVLGGVRLQGGLLEVNPGLFYLAATGGTSKNEIFTDGALAQYHQQLVAGRLGVGRIGRSGINFTFLRAKDDFESLPESNDLTNLNPQSNTVGGTDFRLQFFRARLLFEGEAALSFNNRNDFLPGLDVDHPDYENLPGFLKPNLSTRYGYAYNVSSTIRLFKYSTRLRASSRNISPGYYSFGAPYLRRNLIRYAFLFEQKIFRNQIITTLNYQNDRNHNSIDEFFGSEMESVNMNLQLRFRKLPFFIVNLSQHLQEFSHSNSKSILISMITGYNYSMGQLGMATTLTYNSGINESNLEQLLYGIEQYVLTQSVFFSFPLSITSSFTYYDTETPAAHYNTMGADLSVSSTLRQRIAATIGINYYDSMNEERRTGAYAEINYPFQKYFTLRMRYDNNYYRHEFFQNNQMNVYALKTSLQMNW